MGEARADQEPHRCGNRSAEIRRLLSRQRGVGAYDHICIDLPSNREVTLFKAIARSDLVIIPAQASEPDLREALIIVGDIRDVRETAGRAIPYRLLLTQVYPLRTRVTDFAYAKLERHGLPLFRTALVQRSALPRDVPQRPSADGHRTGEGGRPRNPLAPRRNPRRRRGGAHQPSQGRLTMKLQRPAFLPVTSDINDDQLERLAKEKGVGVMVKPAPAPDEGQGARMPDAPANIAEPPVSGATPRSRMKSVNLELPDYAWTELKIRAAHRQTSVRHIIMAALLQDGFTIADADMIEDGRRLRGKIA